MTLNATRFTSVSVFLTLITTLRVIRRSALGVPRSAKSPCRRLNVIHELLCSLAQDRNFLKEKIADKTRRLFHKTCV